MNLRSPGSSSDVLIKNVTLLQNIAVVANEARSTDSAIQSVLNLVCEYAGWPLGHAYRLVESGGAELEPTGIWHLEHPDAFQSFRRVTEGTRFSSGIGLPGRVMETGEPAWIVDVTKDANFPRAQLARDIKVRAGFAFPLLVGGAVVAVLEFFSRQAAEPDPEILDIMRYVGVQMGQIIERETLHGELVLARDEANSANRAKSTFLASVSHELRTPLNAILGYGELLLDDDGDPLSEEQEYFVRAVVQSGQHLSDLINQVLDLTKIESGELDASFSEVNAHDVARECAHNLADRITQGDLTLRDETQVQDLPLVWTDAVRLRQIVTQLLSNAIKFTPPGGSIALTSRATANGCLRFEVSDTGAGIAKAEQARVFVPFDRLGREAGGAEGAGIGLTVAKQIIERLGGAIGFESEEGVGTTVRFEIPGVILTPAADAGPNGASATQEEIPRSRFDDLLEAGADEVASLERFKT